MEIDDRKEWRMVYAGMAMQGVLSGADSDVKNYKLSVLAEFSVSVADALIAELEKDK
jgi:hypothetical protein